MSSLRGVLFSPAGVVGALLLAILMVGGCVPGETSTSPENPLSTAQQTPTAPSSPAAPPSGPAELPGPSALTLGAKIELAASCLIPQIDSSHVSGSQSSSPLVLGTDEEWDAYLDVGPGQTSVIEDIFGPKPGPVTRIRVLVDLFRTDVDDIVLADPDFSCQGATALNESPESDDLPIAFYGTVPNGTSGNRFFHCSIQEDGKTVLYGRDLDQVVRIVTMYDRTSYNSEEAEVRGNWMRLRQVAYSTYAERTEEGSPFAYLDLQHANFSQLSGPDDLFDSRDDDLFKSRSRITGRVTPEECGETTPGSGDFTVTKYDQSASQEGDSRTTITKAVGRGRYGPNQFSLFKIDSNQGQLSEIPRTFCLRSPENDSEFPKNEDASHCASFETSYAWGEVDFPFSLAPEIENNFGDKPFFEEADLISNTGDNFVIPQFD